MEWWCGVVVGVVGGVMVWSGSVEWWCGVVV